MLLKQGNEQVSACLFVCLFADQVTNLRDIFVKD